MRRGWFGPKRVGWGASPSSREGWLATAVFILAVIGVSIVMRDEAVGWMGHMAVVVAYLIVVAVTYRRHPRGHV